VTPPVLQQKDADVIVAGAGPAGLTTAWRLQQAGVDALVVEARDRVGGRTLTHHVDRAVTHTDTAETGSPAGSDPVALDLGAGWVGPGQDRVRALIDELGLTTFATYTVGANLIEHRRRLRSYRGTVPRLGPVVLVDLAQAQRRLNRMAREVSTMTPWETPRRSRWDQQTLGGWIARNLHTRTGREVMTLAAEAIWAAHPDELSLLHALFYIRSGGSVEVLAGVQGGAQQDRVHGGMQQIATSLAARLSRPPLLESAVRTVTWTPDNITVTATSGSQFSGRRLVLAFAPHLMSAVHFDPPLPALRQQLHQRMPAGTVTKCYALYPTPFWRAAGLSGQATSLNGPVKVTFDASPSDGRPGILLAFLEGRQARQLGHVSEARRRGVVLDCLGRLFGQQAHEPLAYVEKNWAADPYAGGCYAGFFGPNGWTDYGSAVRAPIGPIHFCGSETATRWYGYVDGAIRSGEDTAQCLIDSL